ncbi:MAG: HmuY family protein [Myxococcota bacterium]
MRTHAVAIFSVVALGLGCADDLRDVGVEAGTDASNPDGGSVGANLTSTDEGDGVTLTSVDATSREVWIYMDLETGTQVSPANADDSEDWDIGFQRFNVKVNSGVSGTANAGVAFLADQAFEDVTQAPATEYLVDQPDGDDDDTNPDYVLSTTDDGWYLYDPSNNTLSPRPGTWIVRTVEQNYFKLAWSNYYDAAGTSGVPQFRWAAVDPPEGTMVVEGLPLDATSRDEWVYLKLSDSSFVTVADPLSSMEWDLAFQRSVVRTNSGTSGPGLGGAKEVEEAYASIASSTTTGFIEDSMIPAPGPPGSGEVSGNLMIGEWYNYNPSNHTLSPKDARFVVRSAAGDYFKVEVRVWDDGNYVLGIDPVTREVRTETSTIDASDAETWVYYSFRLGDVVTPEEAATSGDWDLGVSRTRLRTNSGTSGTGSGGAVETTETAIAALTTATGLTTAPDAELPVPGPPGSGTFSGNPALNGWFDYDEMTRTATPREIVFLVQTADGQFAKLQVTGYADGMLTLDWAYAGAGQTDF